MRELDLASVLAAEETDYGWRGLTECGEVIEVRSRDGGRPGIPEDVPRDASVGAYLNHAANALEIYHDWQNWRVEEALAETDAAIRVVSTANARYHRALMLIALGRWREGFAEWEARFEVFEGRIHLPVSSGIPYWNGESLIGKRLLLVHEQGYGESIQQLRYIPMLESMGAEVTLLVPQSLQRLSAQCAPLFNGEADYVCPMLSLMHRLNQTPDTMPRGAYLRAEQPLIKQWQSRIGRRNGKQRIGIAWNSGTKDDRFPRSAPLELFIQAFPDAELFSIQQKEDDDLPAQLGVNSFEFDDFADVAGLIELMDQIVSVDTAALHVAGAIGHPDVTVLLPTYAAWRWQSSAGMPLIYPQMRIIQQTTPGDWTTVFHCLANASHVPSTC